MPCVPMPINPNRMAAIQTSSAGTSAMPHDRHHTVQHSHAVLLCPACMGRLGYMPLWYQAAWQGGKARHTPTPVLRLDAVPRRPARTVLSPGAVAECSLGYPLRSAAV